MLKNTLSELELLHLRLQDALSRAAANGSGVAVLVSHLDRLEDVHEALGRRAGEELLGKVKERLCATVEGKHTVWSLGGGQFALLIPGASIASAGHVARRIVGALDHPFDVRGAAVQLGGSVGIALYPDHGEDADTLVRHADIAASEARQSPVGHAIYVPADRTFPERLALAADLRQAIQQGQLVLHYQPQVDMRSGALVMVEALVRWHHPHRGLLPPGEFIPLAEQTRLIGLLSRFVMRAALEQCRDWELEGLDIPVAVNLSVHDLEDPELPAQVADLLATCGVSPDRLCVEITESALLTAPERARQILGGLRALGVRTSIDDFGTGYSSLAYLKDLPLDELKIDRSFVKDMANDAGARAIVRAVIDLAHELGLRALAEGVEDRETREVLASLGCDIAQGYYFSPPITADHLMDWATRGPDRGLDEGTRAVVEDQSRKRSRKRQERLSAEEEFLARKRAEEALRVSEARYRTVVDNIKDVIFLVDDKSCWAYLNPAWEDVTGFSCGETLGRACLELVHPEDREIPLNAFLGVAARTAESCRFELRFLTRSGEYRSVDAFATTVLDSAGRMVGAYGTLSDITDRKQAEDRRRTLEQSGKLRALGQLASGVAHDLNQSLGLIAGYGNIAMRALDQQKPDLGPVREALPVITQAAVDGGQTVRRLLTFARGRSDGEPERLDVASILREVAGLTAPRWRDAAQADGRAIELRVDAHSGLFICGHSAALREALTNLVFNAVDAMPANGSIVMAAQQDGQRVVVTVSDSGIGMSAEIQARIFEPFFSTKGERGTGLGLAQVFGIVGQHDAEIAVDSTPGRGTVFRLTFAAASPAALPVDTGTHIAEPAPRPNLRILAVDDEPAVGTMIRRMLRPDGHSVVAVTAGEEALRCLETEVFDVVISDVGMGRGMNGWELANEVHRRQPDLPVVLATGWGATIDPSEARMKGIHAILAKPYPPADLQSILARLPRPETSREVA
jgi:PAS domain S-box-containing protein/diguanylate cyclase (GGDEF)-like protein